MKKKLVILGAAAMVAAVAVPALALENEFHGMYRMRGMMTNFQAAGLGAKAPLYPALVTPDSTNDYTLFEQRARLQYIAKASDDLKLVTHFEIDSTWGDAAFTNTRGEGAGLGGDTVNLETKNVYLDFNLPSTKVNMKVGLQGFSDAYKGVFLNDDAAGIVVKGSLDALTLTGGFFRLVDNAGVYGPTTTAAGVPIGSTTGSATSTSNTTGNSLGKNNLDLYLLDAKFAVNKDLSVGGSYYYVYNDLAQSGVQGMSMVGVNAAMKAGIVDVDGFFLYQTGNEIYNRATGADTLAAATFRPTRHLDAYAAQLAAKVNLGTAGNLRAAGLYASGNDQNASSNHTGAFQNVFDTNSSTYGTSTKQGNSTSAGQYYSADMKLLFRNVVNMDSDNAIVASLNNTDQGVQAAFLGYDAKINDKLTATANAGIAFVDKKNSLSTGTAQGNQLGTELNAQVNYALYPALTASLQGAYVFLGNYYDRPTKVANPYLAGVMLNYGF
jgi:hypothetical protein